MARKTLSSSNGTSDQAPVCFLCRKKVGRGEQFLIKVVKESSPDDELFFHILKDDGFKLSIENYQKFDEISEKKVFNPLIVSDGAFNEFTSFLKILYDLKQGNETEVTRFSISNKIFDKILSLDKKRRRVEEYEKEKKGRKFPIILCMGM